MYLEIHIVRAMNLSRVLDADRNEWFIMLYKKIKKMAKKLTLSQFCFTYNIALQFAIKTCINMFFE